VASRRKLTKSFMKGSILCVVRPGKRKEDAD
jgi:hypothetical protein